ncbi:nuclear transport factor 2 family protein [Sphingobacterium sp. HJSM2_6]|uniref:nuclear transport factor 2 family protein n=1 Tax=Sphingobacterium sp. HJSM2_6 TaxID=3366264 RepID=UPI003BC12698
MMKSLIKVFAIVGLVITTSALSFAKVPTNSLNRANVSVVLDAYVNSSVYGQSEFVQEFISEDFVQRFQTGNKQASVKKSAYIKHLKSLTGVKYNCKTAVELMEEANGFSIAKVTLTFNDFIRTDYVQLTTDAGGWKVREVNSVFQNK